MLIDIQLALGVADALVPLFFMSNGTHLSNFASDMEQWPGYMTIGNLSSEIRQIPSMHSVAMVALPLIPINYHKTPLLWLDEQWGTNREVLNKIL